eukprot:1360830-Pyramimonas_sp.AAC.1
MLASNYRIGVFLRWDFDWGILLDLVIVNPPQALHDAPTKSERLGQWQIKFDNLLSDQRVVDMPKRKQKVIDAAAPLLKIQFGSSTGEPCFLGLGEGECEVETLVQRGRGSNIHQEVGFRAVCL